MAVPLTVPGPSGVTAALVMARMKLALLRHGLRDTNQALWIWLALLIGLALAAGTVWAGWTDADLTATALAGWLLGWLVGPLLTGGGDEALRPEYFRSLGFSRWRLSAAVLAGTLIGVGPVVSAVALLCLLARGLRSGAVAALVALPAAAAQLVLLVLLSKLAVAVYGFLLQRRAGALLAGVVTGFALAFTAQGWALVIAFVSNDVAGVLADVARSAPSGWGLVAVEAAGRGEWVTAVAALAGLVLMSAVAYVGWTLLLARRTVATQLRVRPRRPLRAHDASGAALGQQLRSMTRDLLLTNRAVFALSYALFFVGMPLALGWAGMLPWAGPIFVVMAAMMWSNHYGLEGSRLWLTVTTPGAPGRDVRARQQAFAIIVVPLAVAVTVLLTAVAHSPAQWPYVLGTLPALIGAAIGISTLFSVVLATPTTDPHKRSGNPLSTGADAEETGSMYLALLAVCLFAAPPLLAARILDWWAVPVGLATGILGWWLPTRIATRRLETRGVELLDLLAHGRGSASGSRMPSLTSVQLTPPEQRRLMIMGVLAVLSLFPQGIVPLVFLATGTPVRSWFLAMDVPAPWGWLVAVAMIIIGVVLFAFALRIYLRAARRAPAQRRSERPSRG